MRQVIVKKDRGIEKISIGLSIVEFKEGKSFITYCPYLDISGYGETEQEAEESFKYCVRETINYALKKINH